VLVRVGGGKKLSVLTKIIAPANGAKTLTIVLVSVTWPVMPVVYNLLYKLSERARGYQKGWSVNFWAFNRRGKTIDGYYLDGQSMTHGNPCQYIRTFANRHFHDNFIKGDN